MATGETMISRILKSVFFKKAMGRAAGIAKNKAVLLVMLQKVMKKMERSTFRDGLGEVRGQLLLLLRFAKAYATGAYRNVDTKSVVTIIGVLIYFVSPLDLIPDFLPIIGIADDIALVVWLFNTLEGELDKFSAWEKDSRTINIG